MKGTRGRLKKKKSYYIDDSDCAQLPSWEKINREAQPNDLKIACQEQRYDDKRHCKTMAY